MEMLPLAEVERHALKKHKIYKQSWIRYLARSARRSF